MFCIQIAGLSIGMDNRYPYVQQLCHGYETDTPPLFTVHAPQQDLLRQQNADPRYSLAYCESLCLYRALCLQLPLYDAFLMHAAVVAVDGAAYVFSAPSGVGKTTHLRLWLEHFGDRAQVINGDKPVFRFQGEQLYAYGTPWQGKENLGTNACCPVQAVCFLEQSPHNQIRLLTAEELTPHLFPQLLLPKDPTLLARFWTLLERMVTTLPFYLLQCNREPEAMQLSYKTMRGAPPPKGNTSLFSSPSGR